MSPLLTDQFDVKPSGSTAAALAIFILHSVTNLLTTYPYVHVVALCISQKLSDRVKHDVLVSKMFSANLPGYLLNWVSSYLERRGNRIRFFRYCFFQILVIELDFSDIASINASVVQDSDLEPLSF